jgi:predicted DNA-binding transcriptional regulator AlpA
MRQNSEVVPPERLWKVSDVAEFLRMSSSWVYKQAEAGLLPVRRFGASIRFSPDDIRAYARGDWKPQPITMAVRSRNGR